MKRLIRWIIAVTIWLPVLPAEAVCPPGSTFTFDNRIRRSINVPANQRDKSIAEGGFSAVIPLGDAVVDVGMGLSAHGVDTSFNFTNINQRLWQLRVPASSGLQTADIITAYTVEDANGIAGYVSSVNDSSSQVPVSVHQRTITRRAGNSFIRFRGFVNVSGDFGPATHSGRYVGNIITTVDCN